MADKKRSDRKKVDCFFRQEKGTKVGSYKVCDWYRNLPYEIHSSVVEATEKYAQVTRRNENNNCGESGVREDGSFDSDEQGLNEDEELKAVQERIASMKSRLSKIRLETKTFKKSEERKRREVEKAISDNLESADITKKECQKLKSGCKAKKEEREDLLVWQFSYEPLFNALKVDAGKGVCAEGKPVVCNGPAGVYSKAEVCKLLECPILTGKKKESK